jgi:hypothetical protein
MTARGAKAPTSPVLNVRSQDHLIDELTAE